MMLRIILTLLVCGPWVLQAAPETEKEEKPATEKTGEWVQDLIKDLVSVELTEDRVRATIERLGEAIKESNKEKEELLEALKKANNVAEQKQAEIDELGEAAQAEIDTLADQRDAAKAQVEDLKTKLSQKEAESSALTVELARKTKELEEAVRHQERLEAENRGLSKELKKAKARIAVLEGRETNIKNLLVSKGFDLGGATEPVRKAFSGMKLEE